jgi:Flp pilus assembly protein TadD
VKPPPPVITASIPEAIPDAGMDTLAIPHDSPRVDHLSRSGQLKADGDFKGALVEARKALFTSPDDEDALITTARLSRRVGENTLAAEAWGRLAKLRPDDAEPLIQQARALYRAKDYAGAVMIGRTAITVDSGNSGGFQVVGLAQLAKGELKGAIDNFKRVTEINPEHGWALNNLGFAYLRANENEKAVEVLTKASELLPNVAAVHNNLGVALERTGETEEAKAAYQRSMDLSPKYVKARINADRVAKFEVSDDEDYEEPDTLSDVPHTVPDTLTE